MTAKINRMVARGEIMKNYWGHLGICRFFWALSKNYPRKGEFSGGVKLEIENTPDMDIGLVNLAPSI